MACDRCDGDGMVMRMRYKPVQEYCPVCKGSGDAEKPNVIVPALTMTQPWAQFVAVGEKYVETRPWSTGYRGPLAIHSAKSWPEKDRQWCFNEVIPRAICMKTGRTNLSHFDRGSVIAIVRLHACVPTSRVYTLGRRGIEYDPETDALYIDHQERALGNFVPKRWAWLLTDRYELPEAIPARGMLGLWDWSAPHRLSEMIDGRCDEDDPPGQTAESEIEVTRGIHELV